MAMVCPQCAGSYEQRLHCPACNARLLYDHRGPKPAVGSTAVHWQQTPWGRVLIGLVLAQGLYFGLQHLLLGLMEALDNQGLLKWTWTSLSGLLFLQALQVLTLAVGGVLAGGGQRRGVTLGALVGAWNGVIAVLLDPILHPEFVPTLSALSLVGVPLIHVAFGALGGWVGYSIWTPVPPTAVGEPAGPVNKPMVVRPRAPLFAGRVAWFRVALGAAFVAAGYLTAATVFNFIIDFSDGKLASDGFWQDRIVTWEIQALAVLVGGAVAGYNTANGLKQGMCVGLVASGLLTVVLFHFSRMAPVTAVLTVFGCFCLCMAGGWFGSQLFPPVVVYRRPRHFGPAGD